VIRAGPHAAPLAAALALAAAGCGLPEPPEVVRVVGLSPEGADVPTALERAEVTFSGAVSPEGLVDGARLALVPEERVRDALAAVESEAGAAGLEGAVTAEITLLDGGRRAALRPLAPLRARTGHAVVLSSLVRSAGGGPVLDPEGHRRPSVGRFTTGAPPGPPPRPVITEVRADADTPEAGGEWVELANLGEGALDLAGFRLAKRSLSGALSSCALDAGGEGVPPGGVALVVGGAYDGRYALPAGVALARCGTAGLLGGLANDRAPELLLLDPSGAEASSLGAGAAAPHCPGEVVVRVDAEGPDAAWNLACGGEEGTPGVASPRTTLP
jgi:hypothetical protein